MLQTGGSGDLIKTMFLPSRTHISFLLIWMTVWGSILTLRYRQFSKAMDYHS